MYLLLLELIVGAIPGFWDWLDLPAESRLLRKEVLQYAMGIGEHARAFLKKLLFGIVKKNKFHIKNGKV